MNTKISELSKKIISALDDYDFQNLFINYLGWEYPNNQLKFDINDGIVGEIIAQKSGVDVWKVNIRDKTYKKNEVQKFIKDMSEEYFIISLIENTPQRWEFPANGKVIRYDYEKNKFNDAFIQRLIGIKFEPEEVESTNIIDVLNRLNSNFNTDTVSKKFYADYIKLHRKISESVTFTNDEKEKDQFANTVLTRLLFVYFIQKKGFLDGNLDYLRYLFNKYNEGEFYESFYRSLLKPLFFYYLGGDENLKIKDLKQIVNLIGDIPQIKGDLFTKKNIEEEYDDVINIEDNLFEEIYNFLDSYRWHLDETPSLQPNEINPEILGYILQQYVTGVEEGDEAGAFYTKKDITDFISGKTIGFKILNFIDPNLIKTQDLIKDHSHHYIESVFSAGLDSNELLVGESESLYKLRKNNFQNIKMQIEKETISREFLISNPIDIVKICHDLIHDLDENELQALWKKVSELKILDPTCGSGAFLFSGMQLLESIYLQIHHQAEILEHKPTFYKELSLHKNIKYYIAKKIALENLFGVDLMQEGIDVANLRLYLSLVSKLNDVSEIEPMPILEFNIRRGNLLVGFSNLDELGNAAEFETSKLFLDKRAKDMLGMIEKVSNELDQIYEGQLDQDLYSREEHRQTSIRNKLGRIKVFTDTMYHEHIDSELDLIDWQNSHVPFCWPGEFPQIFQNNKGFDIIIGNPPYVQKSKIKSYFFKGGLTTKCPDIYATCTERAINLLNEEGTIGFIVPMTLSWSKKYKSLRDLINEKFKFTMYGTFAKDPAALFNGSKGKVKIRNTIFISNNNCEGFFASNHNVWRSDYRDLLFRGLRFFDSTKEINDVWPKLGNPETRKILDQYSNNFSTQSLGSYLVKESKHKLYYKKVAGYWFPLLFEHYPVYSKDGSIKYDKDPYVGVLNFETKEIKYAVAALLISKFGYLWQAIIGDDFHVTTDFVNSFPLMHDFKNKIPDLSKLGAEAENIILENPEHQIWITNNTLVSNIMWSDKELVDFISNNIDKYIFNSLDIDPYRIEIFNSLYGSLYVRSQDVRGTRGKSPF